MHAAAARARSEQTTVRSADRKLRNSSDERLGSISLWRRSTHNRGPKAERCVVDCNAGAHEHSHVTNAIGHVVEELSGARILASWLGGGVRGGKSTPRPTAKSWLF